MTEEYEEYEDEYTLPELLTKFKDSCDYHCQNEFYTRWFITRVNYCLKEIFNDDEKKQLGMYQFDKNTMTSNLSDLFDNADTNETKFRLFMSELDEHSVIDDGYYWKN